MREGGWLWAGAAGLEEGGRGEAGGGRGGEVTRGNEKLDTHTAGTRVQPP